MFGVKSKRFEGTKLKNKSIFKRVPRSVLRGAGSEGSDLDIEGTMMTITIEMNGDRGRFSMFYGMMMPTEAVTQS